MRPVVLKSRRRRQGAIAAAVAVAAHLLFLLALGWRIPTVAPLQPPDTRPPVEVQLLRRLPARSAPSSAPPSPTARAAPGAIRASPAEPSLPSAPVAAPPAPEAAAGAPDCATEDLPLLTEAEKARCRNQIDADKERRLARGADERAAKQVAEAQRGPQTYRMASEKEAYYAAVAQTYWALSSNGPRGAGHLPGIGCAVGGVPFLGGVETNKNLFEKKKEIRPPKSLKLGPLPCYLVPPQGMLTEESGLDPLDPQWLPKP